MERSETSERFIFTAKGFLVKQLLQEGWSWDAALEHAGRLFSADGDHPARNLAGDELQNVQTFIAYYEEPAGDDYQPRAEETAANCGGLAVHP